MHSCSTIKSIPSMHSSNYTNFSNNAMEGGPVDIRETIQRELEKEMMREKIIAEEVERFHVLEAEVRRELMIGREMMAMKRSSGYRSSFMVGSQPGEVKEITTSLPKVAKPTLYGAEQKPPPPAATPPPPSPPAAGSTELTEKKMEWRCEICNVCATCERGLLKHFAGKKHKVKVATLSVQNSVKTQDLVIKSSKWRCAICDVTTTCERGLHDHLAGKKHRTKAMVEGLKANKSVKIQLLVIKNSHECVPNDIKEDNKKSLPPSRELSKKKMEWKRL